MYKFIVYPLLIIVILTAQLHQLSNHIALQYYYSYKYAINRATHAAAMQLNEHALAEGLVVIEPNKAYEAAHQLLAYNLPRQDFHILLFEVVHVNSNDSPYHYINIEYDISLELYAPSVVLVLEVESPALTTYFTTHRWEIYGTSEIITTFK